MAKFKTKHPVQPVVQDDTGVHRYKSNAIVKYLYAEWEALSGQNLNDLAMKGFPEEDFEQYSQLTGYSVSGLCDLSYVTDRVANKGLRRSEKLSKILDKLQGK
jgi:hypothetical protein